MKNIGTSAIESTAQFNPKHNTSARTYVFKKRKPLPGAYPKNFSPYVLNHLSTTRAVPLSRTEIRDDLNFIQQAITQEFSSRYFDEVTSTPEIERGNDAPRQHDVPCQKPPHQQIIQRRAHRKPKFSSFQVPTTEAEERRQLRAAMKASQLEAARTNNIQHPESRTLKENWSPATKEEAVNGALLLRAVCSGSMFRTG